MGTHRLSSSLPVRGNHRRFRSILLLAVVASAAAFLLSVSSWSSVDNRLPLNRHSEDDPDDLFFNEEWKSSHLDGESADPDEMPRVHGEDEAEKQEGEVEAEGEKRGVEGPAGSCVTVEKMGEAFAGGFEKESLRVREVIRRHFDLNGAARVRELPPSQFCKQGFVMGKSSEAGFGNEMYKILTAAALSVMLNRSLIIGQTRQLYPFGDYISYTNLAFTLKEVKHLWRKNECDRKYGRNLVMRVDNFEHPKETNVLCSNWRTWKQPIIWFQGTTDAVGIQFFLKNINSQMKDVAEVLFGQTETHKSRPNVFGELLRVIISPTQAIKEAVDWVLQGKEPDIALHMRMLTNRSIRATKAAVECIKRTLETVQYQNAKPRIVLVSDTPSFIAEITPYLTDFAEVLHFNYQLFQQNNSTPSIIMQQQPLEFRVKDWGPSPRWVAFVDFFLASRAKHAVISGAHRRVGTTYAQLIAALAAANQHGNVPTGSNFSFFSSFHSNLLVNGLSNQIGWGHIWNRFSGPLSCHQQIHQCALTPLLPPAWWDGEWQSPISRDIRRMQEYGVKLTETGGIIERSLQSFCSSRKDHVKSMLIFGQYKI